MTLFDTGREPLLDIWIPWTPKVKDRPRFTKTGRVFTAAETVKAEQAVRDAFVEAAPDWTPFDSTCRVEWVLTNDRVGIMLYEQPDYTQRKLRGDVDNYQKLLSDALNGVLFDDDRRIVSTEATKL